MAWNRPVVDRAGQPVLEEAAPGPRNLDEHGVLVDVQGYQVDAEGYRLNAAGALSLIHISEPTRPLYISYAVFCLKKKKN